MNKIWKKLAVILPVFILTCFFIRARFKEEYSHSSSLRIFGLLLCILLLYAWIIFMTIRKRQETFWQILLQSSFFVYIFMVLTLTGYFILFKEISSHDWWDKMVHRVEIRDKVNLTAFKTMKIYKPFDKQIVGNVVMLLPLGLFIPLNFSKIRKFLPVVSLCFLTSVLIELMQLITSYRSTDVDDVILNTTGACIGFLIYKLLEKQFIRLNEPVLSSS
jgi:glycopeptide antibiotics resistance protein